MRVLAVSKFKAHCLAVLDEVSRTGEAVTLLKCGKPLARVLPPVAAETGHAQDRLVGTVEVLGDVVSPALPADVWEAEGRLAHHVGTVAPRGKGSARKRKR
jgi:antitoxin (DNA-binding transcriptional repressor) of toxin-antitoxin stability system